MAEHFRELVRSDSRFEIVAPPFLTLTVFRILPPSDLPIDKNTINNTSLNALNRIFHDRLSRADLFLTSIVLNGIFGIRLAVGSQRTEERHIQKTWDILSGNIKPAVMEWLESGCNSKELAG